MKIKYVLFSLLILILAGCGEEAAPVENSEREEPEISVSFRNLDIQVEDTSFVLTGEVNTVEGLFYYDIKQGDKELLSEQSVDVSDESTRWVSFEIAEDIPKEANQAEEAPIITMYGKTADDEVINPNYIPIDIGIK